MLLGVGEEFDIALSAVVAYHCKTGTTVAFSCGILHIDKAPIHLVGFTRSGAVPTSAIPLRAYQLSWCRNKVLVFFDIDPNLRDAAGVPHLLKFFLADNGIGHIGAQKTVQNPGETG